MRVKLKRVLSFVSAVVICGVSCVTSWFSVPVSAIGVFSPFNFYQLYQMLHGLLLGDGGGNSQTFGEWLEKNMTRTIGSGNDKHVFLLTPGEKLGDMMSEASIRLALGAACTDGGAAGLSKMKDLIDSWNEVYDTSDIGEIGESGSGGDSGWLLSSDGCSVNIDFVLLNGVGSNSSPVTAADGSYGWIDAFSANQYVSSDVFGASHKYIVYCSDGLYFIYTNVSNLNYSWQTSRSTFWIHFASASGGGAAGFSFPGSQTLSSSVRYNRIASGNGFVSNTLSLLHAMGVDLSMTSMSISDYVSKIDYSSYTPSSDFIGPVYAIPAAKQLITDTGTLSGLRLDVQTEDGIPDISAALDHAGVDNVDDLVSGVAAGTIPMSQVYEDMRVVPYVLTDVETGEVVTDLGVSATDAKTKAVALDKTLSIPKDVSAVDAYQVTGKTWDPEMSKYKLPLFQFFPFCLPWDIYEVLTLFDAEPVAPKFTIPVGQFFTRFSGSVDTSKAADQKAVVDLGSDSWQSTFKVIRALECAAIIIGLCLTAVLLIHGGR